MMNQNEIGRFLRQLRSQKGWTQAQLAEKLNVSNRSVSRWETGATMPDLSLLIELSELYKVSVDSILDAGQKNMTTRENQTIAKVADYAQDQEKKVSRRMMWLFITAFAGMVIYALIDINGLQAADPWEDVASFCLGLITGTLLVGILYTSGLQKQVAAAKARLLHR